MTDARKIIGGPPTPSLTLVQTDGATILGDGSNVHPLRVNSEVIDGTFRATFSGGGVQPRPGISVFISFVDLTQPGTVTTVEPTVVNAADDSGGLGLSMAFATVAGVIAQVNEDGSVQILRGGLLTLTTGQWDAVTGTSGGLLLGDTYYPSATTAGEIVNAAPAGVGQFMTKIGTAVSATTMLIQPSSPRQNLADQIVFSQFSGQPLPVGTAVVFNSSSQVVAATSDVSVPAGQAIGLIAGFDLNQNPIVQLWGVVTLTVPQWAAVIDTVGLQVGNAYFVDTSAHPGRLTGSPPNLGDKVQLGVALSATRFALSTPYSQRLS